MDGIERVDFVIGVYGTAAAVAGMWYRICMYMASGGLDTGYRSRWDEYC